MNVVIEAIQDSAYVTGTDRIAYNVLRELQTLDQTNHYRVICRHGQDYVAKAVTGANFTVVRRRIWQNRVARKFINRPLRQLQDWYYQLVVKPDVYYSIHNLSSPTRPVAPLVTNALDVIPLMYPEQYFGSPADRERYFQQVRQVATQAAAVVAISNYTKHDLVERLHANPEQIEVVMLAAEPSFQPELSQEQAAKLREKYHLPEKYVLTLGSNEPRKNVKTAVAAWDALPAAVREGRGLVVTGGAWKHGRGDNLEPRDDIIFTGFVDDADLPGLYASAEAFVFLSTYEGFGLPPLEAMACGTPVIASNTTSIPEVTGESAALLVEPMDVTAAAAALESVLTKPEVAARQRKAGLARAGEFSWRATTEQILKVLERVGGHHDK